jgi:uncharacterized protein YdiU (UPF0061 family)
LKLDLQNTFLESLSEMCEKSYATPAPAPELLIFNNSLAEELNLSSLAKNQNKCTEIFSGREVLKNSQPVAQAYSGHQFGHFNPALGDGRALLLGESVNTNGDLRDIQLKGSGPTPFSRRGDGKSALGPVLREYLISESMNVLGIPTTRALAAIKTGENVQREQELPGGVITRVASSHIRVGSFEYAYKSKNQLLIKDLADYSINRHFPETAHVENPYLAFFAAVCNEQASLVANWMSVGFIHGVMNTDNMTISGETIDYGPCAFMDAYDPSTVFSSIDKNGRYSYENQPKILTWNLTRLAETLIPLVDKDQNEAIKLLTEVLQLIKHVYTNYWLSSMRSKIGLSKEEQNDINLISQLLNLMESNKVDFTLCFRYLSKALVGDIKSIKNLFKNNIAFDNWMSLWKERISQEGISDEKIASSMNAVNPIYIPRNHKVEKALDAVVLDNNIAPFLKLHDILKSPYEEIKEFHEYEKPAKESSIRYKTFCGT